MTEISATQAKELAKNRLLALGEQYADFGGRRLALDLVMRGRPESEFLNLISHQIREERVPTLEGLGLNRKEIKQYSVGRALAAAARGDWSYAGLEHAVGCAASIRAGHDEKFPCIPWGAIIAQRDFNTGTATEAGNLISHGVVGPVTGSQRPQFVLAELGAQIRGGFKGGETVPSFGTAITVGVKTEVQAAAQANPKTTARQITPARICAYLPVSRQTLINASQLALDALTIECQRALQQELERLALNGSGSGEPYGIRNTTGVGSVVAGDPDGAQITWAHLVSLEKTCISANGSFGQSGYVVNGSTLEWLKKTPRIASGSVNLWNDMAPLPVNGHAASICTQLPSNLTKGAGTSLSSIVYSSNWSALLVALCGPGFDVMLDPVTLSDRGQSRLILSAYIDSVVLDVAAFAKLDDGKTS